MDTEIKIDHEPARLAVLPRPPTEPRQTRWGTARVLDNSAGR